jgi:hypothetical protein
MPNPSGEGWEIDYRLIEPDLAQQAGLEVLSLIAATPDFVTKSPGEASGVEIYRVANWVPDDMPADAPNRDQTLYVHRYAYPGLFMVVGIMVASIPEISERVDYGTFPDEAININLIAPGAVFPWHQDQGKPRAAAQLIGRAEAEVAGVEDPVAMPYPLGAGDVLRLKNVADIELNPWHRITNTGNQTRVSIVL